MARRWAVAQRLRLRLPHDGDGDEDEDEDERDSDSDDTSSDGDAVVAGETSGRAVAVAAAAAAATTTAATTTAATTTVAAAERRGHECDECFGPVPGLFHCHVQGKCAVRLRGWCEPPLACGPHGFASDDLEVGAGAYLPLPTCTYQCCHAAVA